MGVLWAHTGAIGCIVLNGVANTYTRPFQKLCDYVCDLLLEESNVQPVSTPVTICGDIHGQVRNLVAEGLSFTVEDTPS